MNIVAPQEALSGNDLAIKGVLLNADRESVVLPRGQNILIRGEKMLIVEGVVLGGKINGSSQVIVGDSSANRERAASGPPLTASVSIFAVAANKMFLDLGTVVVDIAIAHLDFRDPAVA